MRADQRILVCCALCFPALAVCDVASTASSSAPSPELLEFLGSWETDDGLPVDPWELDDMAIPDAKGKTDEQDDD